MSQWSNTWQPLRSRGTHPTRRRLDNNRSSRARICPFLPLCHILQNDLLGNNARCPTWSCPLARSSLSLWNWDLQFKTIQVLQQINKVFTGQLFRKWSIHRHMNYMSIDRSSGISTPTTVSCGNLNQSSSCHAVNFGFISSSASDSFPTINIDRVRQRDAFSGDWVIIFTCWEAVKFTYCKYSIHP